MKIDLNYDKLFDQISENHIKNIIIFKQFDYSQLQNKYFYIESFNKLTEDYYY